MSDCANCSSLLHEVEALTAHADWYREQALDNEAAARRLEGACERALAELEDVMSSSSFDGGMRRLFKARKILRERHAQ